MLIRGTRVCWEGLEVMVPTRLSPPPPSCPRPVLGDRATDQLPYYLKTVGWSSSRELKMPFGVGSPASVSI